MSSRSPARRRLVVAVAAVVFVLLAVLAVRLRQPSGGFDTPQAAAQAYATALVAHDAAMLGKSLYPASTADAKLLVAQVGGPTLITSVDATQGFPHHGSAVVTGTAAGAPLRLVLALTEKNGRWYVADLLAPSRTDPSGGPTASTARPSS